MNGERIIDALSIRQPTAAQVRRADGETDLLAFATGTSPTIIGALCQKDRNSAESALSRLIE